MISMFGISYFTNFVILHMLIISRLKFKLKGAPRYNGFAGRNGVASRVILYEPRSLRDWLVIVIQSGEVLKTTLKGTSAGKIRQVRPHLGVSVNVNCTIKGLSILILYQWSVMGFGTAVIEQTLHYIVALKGFVKVTINGQSLRAMVITQL